jgi:pimeloyl-ACP methyl ester carboxylesterase
MKRLCLIACSLWVASTTPHPDVIRPAFGQAASARAAATAAYDTVRVNGIDLAHRVIGDGEPLLLLHGFSGTGAMWEPLFDAFSDYQLIVPDLRGHGHSTNPDGEFTHRQAALDMFALLDRLGIRSFKAIGGSTGGMTLLHMATGQPERVEAMILVGATSFFPESARQIMRGRSPDNAPTEQLEALAARHSRGTKQARALISQFHAFKDSYDDMNFTPPYLATIQASTLIVHGDRDRFFPVSIPVEQYRSIPNSYLWIIPNAGHGAPLWSERGRDTFSAIALDFLGGEWE